MTDRRLPTRVSNACSRCRRQKQRCDRFRPCSNCVKAGHECSWVEGLQSTSTLETRQRKRLRTSASSPPARESSEGLSPRRRVCSPLPSIHHSTQQDELGKRRNSQGGVDDMTRREHSIVAEFGHSNSAMDITRRVLRHRSSDHQPERATFAIPGGDVSAQHRAPETYHNIKDLIGIELPPKDACDILIDVYFFTIHWFSLVVYEPTFRRRYHAISNSNFARATDRPFLLLLLMMLALSCQYAHSFIDMELHQNLNLTTIRTEYLRVVRQNFMDLLDGDSLEFVQICTLLGSYWLYWGKPRSSFSILGACMKAAQAIDLHRGSSRRLLPHSNSTVEERKRVWWTIYTWDRFATIVYGRPFGINDKDCDVPMPSVFQEHLIDVQTRIDADVEISPYQAQLNQVYKLASPLLEDIYGIRSSGDISLLQMAETAERIDKSIQEWNRSLPKQLNFDTYEDLTASSSLDTKMHQLQSLSLQLTYMNLMIIIHRPLLADWSQRRGRESRNHSIQNNTHIHQTQSGGVLHRVYERSFQRCLEAALAISRIERGQPTLIQLAGKTHLVSFLGMNLFTSSVVLFICALSDVLSDAAQEAKRGIARNLRVLKSLSNVGSLSSQCTTIIEDLVQIVMEKERKQMLMGPLTSEDFVEPPPNRNPESFQRIPNQRMNHENPTDSTANFQSMESLSAGQVSQLAGGTSTSLEQTMESLHKVLKVAANPRPQPRSSFITSNPIHQSQINTDPMVSAPEWPDTYNNGYDFYSADDLQTQDMGQFWLWDMGSQADNLSPWNMEDFHF